MSTLEVAPPEQAPPAEVIAPTGGGLHPDIVTNLAALSPCPACGANALEGPEGWAWAHLPHCWRCGWNWKKPAQNVINAPQTPSLPPQQIASLAAAVAAQVKDQLLAAGWSPPAPAAPPVEAASTEVPPAPEPAASSPWPPEAAS